MADAERMMIRAAVGGMAIHIVSASTVSTHVYAVLDERLENVPGSGHHRG
jgi:hypothetical protein